jgi:hypothetical protein
MGWQRADEDGGVVVEDPVMTQNVIVHMAQGRPVIAAWNQ